VVGIVQLDEGPWWWAQLVGVDPDELRAGQRLRVEFQRPDSENNAGHEAVAVFRPEGELP
jgi:uncharacterized OB-fold protein